MSYPDPNRSQALIVGVSEFPALPMLPAVDQNVSSLRENFCSTHSLNLPMENCTTVLNPKNPHDLLGPLRHCADEAEDLLIFYYAGYTALGSDRALYLPVEAEPSEHHWLGIQSQAVTDPIFHSRAAAKVVILDCFFSGAARPSLALIPTMRRELGNEVANLCVIASSSTQFEHAADPTRRFTAFSGELIDILETGVNRPSIPFLTSDLLYEELTRRLTEKGLPRPERLSVNNSSEIIISQNAALRPFANQQTAITTHPPRTAPPASPVEQPLVFLCHSSGDKERVRTLYRRLVADDVNCWFDEESLLPGQDWDYEITRQIRSSKYVLVCLSESSLTKRGYVQKEIVKALDVADEQPEGVAYIIPVRLEECDVPQRLRRWHWSSLFLDGAYERLLSVLKSATADPPAHNI